MMKNHCLAKALSDASFAEIRRQLEYKVKFYGGQVTLVDRWFPSSKMCSGCGNVKDKLSLSERTYKCSECGLTLDRDLNAALNLKNTVELTEIKALGEVVRLSVTPKAVSVKRENLLLG